MAVGGTLRGIREPIIRANTHTCRIPRAQDGPQVSMTRRLRFFVFVVTSRRLIPFQSDSVSYFYRKYLPLPLFVFFLSIAHLAQSDQQPPRAPVARRVPVRATARPHPIPLNSPTLNHPRHTLRASALSWSTLRTLRCPQISQGSFLTRLLPPSPASIPYPASQRRRPRTRAARVKGLPPLRVEPAAPPPRESLRQETGPPASRRTTTTTAAAATAELRR